MILKCSPVKEGNTLDEKGFKVFCSKSKLDKETIQANVRMVKGFEAFLKKTKRKKDLSNATPSDLKPFVKHLMESGMNTWDNFLALLRYARFINNREVEVALLELLDGSDVLEKLSDILRQSVGESKRKEIFKGIELPPLGTSSKDKPKITKKFMERLETDLGEDKCREILLSGPHAGPKEYYLEERKSFLGRKA